MGWEHQLAQTIKETGERAKTAAVEDASAFVGIIEQAKPLKISILGGEAMYEDDEIIQGRTFARLSNDVKKKGVNVIVIPVDNLDTIAVLDVIEE